MYRYFILSISLFFATFSFGQDYETEIMKWRSDRIQNLTRPISWSSLVGLSWLDEGENLLGSSKAANIRFPKSAPDVFGKIQYKDGNVTFQGMDGYPVQIKDSLVTEVSMISDLDRGSQRLNHESYYFTLINRNDKLGIRIWDTLHHERQDLKSLDYYPIDPSMKVEATFTKYDQPKKVKMQNVLGMDVEQEIEGYLTFQLNGKDYKIEPLGMEYLFLIFADETTGGDTYGGGRYLYAKGPDENGKTIIDFNKAHTPPCGFTSYATCLLPSKENTMDIEVLAGEKYSGH